MTVAALPSNAGGYNVYVYADGDNGSATRTGAYRISGTGITTTSVKLTDVANTNFSGTFTQGNNSNGNYVMFTITAASLVSRLRPPQEHRPIRIHALLSTPFRSFRINPQWLQDP